MVLSFPLALQDIMSTDVLTTQSKKMRRCGKRVKSITWIMLTLPLALSVFIIYVGFGLGQHSQERNYESSIHIGDYRIVQSSITSDTFSKPKEPHKSAQHLKNNAIVSNSHSGKQPTISHLQAQRYHKSTILFRQHFNCALLFQKDPFEQNRTRHYFKRHGQKEGEEFSTLTPAAAIEIMQDCQYFKRIRNYRTDGGSSEEEDFPLAYVITAHRDFEHVERLLRALYRPQHVFCIHVDKKVSESLKKAIASLTACFPNVVLASNPQAIIYAHVSRLLADVTCMKDILASGRPWRYLINMAATEFPLKTNKETINILGVLNGLNDIHESFVNKVETRWKVEYVVVDGVLKASKKALPPAPYNITVTKGQAYNTYSREFVEWFLSDRRALDFLEWSKLTYSPDEHFWGSLNNLYHNEFLHTPGGFYGNPEIKGYLTKFISWQGVAQPRHRCYGEIVHNICIFSFEDLPILPSQKHLAANKFDLTVDPVAYSCMEELLENKTKLAVPIDLQRYKHLHFVRFKPSRNKKAKDVS